MDINQLLEDILKRLRPIADKRNIDLILDCVRPVDADVAVSYTHLKMFFRWRSCSPEK